MATHSSILAWKSHRQRSLAGYSPWGLKRVGHNLETKQQQQTYTMLGFSIYSAVLPLFLGLTPIPRTSVKFKEVLSEITELQNQKTGDIVLSSTNSFCDLGEIASLLRASVFSSAKQADRAGRSPSHFHLHPFCFKGRDDEELELLLACHQDPGMGQDYSLSY